ncbi:MAG: glycosyltransferase family 39 protein [Vicinamibacterales bacterium]
MLGLAIYLGIAGRLVAVAYFGDRVSGDPGVADQISYHTLAQRLIGGHGFTFATGWWPATPAGQPTAHWSYLYVIALSAAYSVVGVSPLVVRLLQALAVGVLHPYLTWRVTRRVFGVEAAAASAVLAAIYAYFVYYAAALMTEALYFVAILWALDLALELGAPTSTSAAGVRRWWMLGVAFAVAVLFRQVFLPCVPVVLAWLLWRRVQALRVAHEGWPVALARSAVRCAIPVVVLAAAIAPWTARNYRAFDRFVPLNTNAGFAFFWGNHPVHGFHFKPLLPDNGPSYGDLIPDELRPLNEAALDRALLARGLRFIVDDPIRYAALSAGRLAEFFKFWPTHDSSATSNAMRALSFGLYLPFVVAGLVMTARGWRRASAPEVDRAGASLLVMVAGVYTALHVLSWALVRYRLPVDAMLMPFAGLALARAIDAVSAAFGRRLHVAAPLSAARGSDSAGSASVVGASR